MHFFLLPIKISLQLLFKPLFFITFILLIIILIFFASQSKNLQDFKEKVTSLSLNENSLRSQLVDVEKELGELKNQDQYKKNSELEDTISNIEKTYKEAVTVYEQILDYKGAGTKKTKHEGNFAKALRHLSDRNYASASSVLSTITKEVKEETTRQAAAFTIPENVKTNNAPPSSGYSRQRVSTDIGDFLVDIVTADLNSTRVIVDTASDSDCSDACPVLSLSEYVSRNGAFAGVNGSYFCPEAYPSCAGRTNSFDTLLMNKNKTYFNSGNNVYSSVPAVIFSGSSARFISQSLEWGRDTSVDSVIANHPLLVLNGEVAFGGNSDPKQGGKGSRSFVGASGSTVYIGVVHNSTVAEVARVLHKMGMQHALNLDSGGSTALWSGGYKAGPGRNIPNALLFIQR